MKTQRPLQTLPCLALLVVAVVATGCQTVKPWQRATLGDELMRPGRDPLGLAFSEHVWFSREAASGGRGVGGGGCGCN
ncbi:MAG: DUF4266 domain-containing protein [Verrucomicrobia bacterium]|nr:MAG: DUF4266 domain-containing protein [Verrucomicrobiota bacterium]